MKERLPPEKMQIALRGNSQNRMESMRGYRLSWWAHWAQLAEMYLPRRYRWFITPNQYNRGSPINGQIVDETGVLAARTLASGLLAGLTSPTKPWFRLGLRGVDTTSEGPTKVWLAACQDVMTKVYSESNVYQALGTCYHDLAVFASAAMIQYEDVKDVVRFYNPCLGEFFFGLSNRLDVDTLYREYTYTVAETVKEFGLENCSPSVQSAYKSGGASHDQEIVIGHAIEPNVRVYRGGEDLGMALPPRFTYREVFWESTTAQGVNNAGNILRCRGFMESPFVGARWDITSNDAYGRGPGMDGLPAVRQLQIEQRRKAEAIDKQVRPPMVASVSMKNEPLDTLPGGVSYVADVAGSGFKPAYSVMPQIAEMKEDLKEVQARVNSVFFVDLFLMISQLDTVRTATEIDARKEEKLIQLGPVIERFENEVLDPLISRTFAICARRGLFPPAPAEIQGREIQVQYISMLAEAQRAASTSAIERLAAFVGSLAGAQPQILDNIDTDEMVEEYADLLGVSPKIIRASKEVIAIRQARQQAQQQAAALQTGQAMASGAQTLSQTDVGGGQNALQKMIAS